MSHTAKEIFQLAGVPVPREYVAVTFPRYKIVPGDLFGYGVTMGLLFQLDKMGEWLGIYNTIALTNQRLLAQVGSVIEDGKFEVREGERPMVVSDFDDLKYVLVSRGFAAAEQLGSGRVRILS